MSTNTPVVATPTSTEPAPASSGKKVYNKTYGCQMN